MKFAQRSRGLHNRFHCLWKLSHRSGFNSRSDDQLNGVDCQTSLKRLSETALDCEESQSSWQTSRDQSRFGDPTWLLNLTSTKSTVTNTQRFWRSVCCENWKEPASNDRLWYSGWTFLCAILFDGSSRPCSRVRKCCLGARVSELSKVKMYDDRRQNRQGKCGQSVLILPEGTRAGISVHWVLQWNINGGITLVPHCSGQDRVSWEWRKRCQVDVRKSCWKRRITHWSIKNEQRQ
jgi:hypothetical protein